jgi:hypothetical protein
MKAVVRKFELAKDVEVVMFTAHFAVSAPGQSFRMARELLGLVQPLRDLPVARPGKYVKRNAYFASDQDVYILREGFRSAGDPDAAIRLDEALRAGSVGRTADPHLYVHHITDDMLVSRVPIPIADRWAGRERVKHVDLIRPDIAPVVTCAGEVHLAFAGNARQRVAAVITNKSGSFLPRGASLDWTVEVLIGRYRFEVIVAIDYDRRSISVHAPGRVMVR